MRSAGRPQASFRSGSREKLLFSTGSDVPWQKISQVRVKLWLKTSLKSLPQRGVSGRETAESETDRSHVEARVESAAAVETNFIGIEFVEIVEDAADGEAFVIVERLLEDGQYVMPPLLSIRFLPT